MQTQELSQLLPKPDELSALTKEESEFLSKHLSHPSCIKYFKIMHYNALVAIADNEAMTPEDKEKLASRFNRLRGMRDVLSALLSISKGGKP